MRGLCHINKNRLRDNLAVILLHWYAMFYTACTIGQFISYNCLRQVFLLTDLVTHNLYMHVTTNVVSAIPSINEYCMNVNVWTQGAANLTLNVAKWVSYKSLNNAKLASTSV